MPDFVSFEVTVNAKAYVNSLRAIAKPELDKVVALALVDTVKSAKVKAAGLIAKRTGLKVGTVKERINYDRVDVGDYEARIKSSKKAIPLIEFPTRQVAGGVATRAWGKPQVIKGAFITTTKNGHTGVFRRVGKRRLPIQQLWGPTIGARSRPRKSRARALPRRCRSAAKALARRGGGCNPPSANG